MKETLEEAAEKYAEIYRCPATNGNEYCKHDIISAFNNGAKWQAERGYTEEDLREAFKQSRQCKIFEKDMPPVYNKFEDWFEQFKKK